MPTAHVGTAALVERGPNATDVSALARDKAKSAGIACPAATVSESAGVSIAE